MVIRYYAITILRYSPFYQFGDYLALFVLDLFQELEDVCDLWHDDLLEIILCQFAADGQFIGPLHRLIEIASEPSKVLLVLPEQGGHLVQRLDSAYSAKVVELPDCISDHRADILIIGCLLLEEGILLGGQPYLVCYRLFIHIILKIRKIPNKKYELRVFFPNVSTLASILLEGESTEGICGHESTTC